jgi:hypothetical protein
MGCTGIEGPLVSQGLKLLFLPGAFMFGLKPGPFSKDDGAALLRNDGAAEG